MYVKKKLIIIRISFILLLLFIITFIAIRSNTEVEEVDSRTKVNEQILKMLESQGIDVSELNTKNETEFGATILGGALPVRQFRTLAEAEKEFGYYLGLHNKIDSLSDYKLIAMHIINREIMKATYEHTNETSTIVVKTSKIIGTNGLTEVYDKYNFNRILDINGISVSISGDTSELIMLAYFSVPNGKNYSIHTAYGLSKKDMESLISELINNLMKMNDWVD